MNVHRRFGVAGASWVLGIASTLVLGDPQDMHATISGFTFADQLVLEGVTASATYSGGILSVGFIALTVLGGSLAGCRTPKAT